MEHQHSGHLVVDSHLFPFHPARHLDWVDKVDLEHLAHGYCCLQVHLVPLGFPMVEFRYSQVGEPSHISHASVHSDSANLQMEDYLWERLGLQLKVQVQEILQKELLEPVLASLPA